MSQRPDPKCSYKTFSGEEPVCETSRPFGPTGGPTAPDRDIGQDTGNLPHWSFPVEWGESPDGYTRFCAAPAADGR